MDIVKSAKILAYQYRLLASFDTRKLRGPLCSFLWFHKKIHQFFT